METDIELGNETDIIISVRGKVFFFPFMLVIS